MLGNIESKAFLMIVFLIYSFFQRNRDYKTQSNFKEKLQKIIQKLLLTIENVELKSQTPLFLSVCTVSISQNNVAKYSQQIILRCENFGLKEKLIKWFRDSSSYMTVHFNVIMTDRSTQAYFWYCINQRLRKSSSEVLREYILFVPSFLPFPPNHTPSLTTLPLSHPSAGFYPGGRSAQDSFSGENK